MHSSTSNSEAANARRAIKLLLTGVCLVLLSLELGARFLVPLCFWNVRRFHDECAAALSIGRADPAGEAEILLLGNSLTFTDIDVELLRQRLGAKRKICRWAVDNTNYLDWLYGLRRAIRNGAKPTLVVIGGHGGHFLAGNVRGRFFARYILDWPDLLNAASRTGANDTALSDMALAQFSDFYGSREEIFKRWLTAVLPSFPDLGLRMALDGAAKPMPQPEVSALLEARLDELHSLCSDCGAKLVIWIPPTPKQGATTQLLSELGSHRGIPVILPLPPRQGETWAQTDFADGFHMTPAAASRFTSLFAGELERLMSREQTTIKKIAALPVGTGASQTAELIETANGGSQER